VTYLAFHFRFNVPLLAVALALAWPSWHSGDTFALLATCAIVMAFTYPWDNWAVREGIWDFPGDRVLCRIGHLPIEECAFFLIETAQVCLLADALAARLIHLLFWMLPVVAIQWLIGGAWIGRPVAVCGAALLVGGILTLFDAIAIRHGIWFFDESQTLGIKVGNVPIEEAIFFLLTALLVAQSYALFAM
jgi:putative membrane protein